MGLVQNLKKMLLSMAEKVLIELFCHYIKQRAKLTTKKQDNYSLTTCLQNPLTTETQHSTIVTSYQGTSEKIIMNQKQMQKICQKQVDDIIDRMHVLCAEGRSNDAEALYAEIRDWVVQKRDLEVLSLDYINDLMEDG